MNDATDIAAKLQSLGFTVVRSLDQTKEGMELAIADFAAKASYSDVALFYYAGHGISSKGSNYLVPVDANLPQEVNVPYRCTNANMVLDQMEEAHCKMKIVILDACRNNPFARGWKRSVAENGLAMMQAPKGTFIAYSTAPGDVAQDGKPTDHNSPYTAALLKVLDMPNLELETVFKKVLQIVSDATNDQQNPWTSGSFKGEFIFNKK